MKPDNFFSYFDRIIEAQGAVPRLRRFILDLAVRGRLAEQDSADEPVHELLRKISLKKLELVRKLKIKEGKPRRDPEVEGLFNIPSTWRWVRLDDVTEYIGRGKSPKYAVGEGLPVVSQRCVQWRGLDLSMAKLIKRDSLGGYKSVSFLREDDLLWNSTGTGTIGRVVRVIDPPKNLVCDSHVTIVRCLEINAEYIRSWLRSDHVYGSIEGQAAGSTNQVELTLHMALNQVVPLPPLEEQRRIVARVDELLALCDQLEEQLAIAQTERRRLLEAVLCEALTEPGVSD